MSKPSRGRRATLLAAAGLLAWPTAVAAEDLAAAVSPPLLEDARDALDQAVGDAGDELGAALGSIERILEPQDGAPTGSGNRARPSESDGGMAASSPSDEPTLQVVAQRDRKRDDIDDLVATGDEIGGAKVRGGPEDKRSLQANEVMPFSGFSPVRPLMVGVLLILAGLALLGSARARLERASMGGAW